MTQSGCPPLDDLVRRTVARGRRRRLAAGAWAGVALGSLTLIALEVHRFLAAAAGPPPYGHGAALLTALAAGAAVVLAALAAAARAPDAARVVRDLDRALALDDLLPTAYALSQGRSQSALAPLVFERASAAVAEAGAAPAVPDPLLQHARRRVPFLVALALLALLACVVLDWLGSFGWPFGLRFGAGAAGIAPTHAEGSDRKVPGMRPAPGGDDEGAAPQPVPDGDGRPAARPDPAPDAPPEADRGPALRATARPSRTSYTEKESVLVSVGAIPTRTPDRDRELSVSMELDGREAPASGMIRVGPGTPLGAGEIQNLRRVPALADRLGPGEHTVRARLRDRRDGSTFDSEPATFRVEGDPQGGGGGGAPQPKPAPQPAAGAPEPEPPPSATPEPPGTGAAPPPPPDRPVGFEREVVVPLFADGEEVTKQGLRVVLVPGAAPSDPPRRAPLADALPDAVRRAESQVDAAAVRAEDADLVRRYFEELRRALR